MIWNCDGAAGANREGGEILGDVIVALLSFERTVAIGGGVALCSAFEDLVEGEGDEAVVDAEGGSGVR